MVAESLALPALLPVAQMAEKKGTTQVLVAEDVLVNATHGFRFARPASPAKDRPLIILKKMIFIIQEKITSQAVFYHGGCQAKSTA